MSRKKITSKDTRKPFIVQALKDASNATKVTQICEDNDFYYGICMEYNPDYSTGKSNYSNLGEFSVSKKSIKIPLI